MRKSKTHGDSDANVHAMHVGAAFHAGRVMLKRIHHLAKERVDFAFETTLASRTYAPWIKELKQDGYIFHLVFLWLPNEEFAIARVSERVRMGGHNVPEDTIRRRYNKGRNNFFDLYMPLADTWFFYDNSIAGSPRLIASADQEGGISIDDELIWKQIKEESHEG